MAEIEHNTELIIALKYLIQINLFYIRISDFPIQYCIEKMNLFLSEVETIQSPAKSEAFCRGLLKSLILYLSRNGNMFVLNEKLEKLVELIVCCHQASTRGLVLVRTRHHTKALCEFLNQHSLIKQVVNLYKIFKKL